LVGPRAPVAARRRGGSREDGSRTDPRRRAQDGADPAAVLRGPRRQHRRVRVGLSPPDARDPPARGAGRGEAGGDARHLQRAVPDPAPAGARVREVVAFVQRLRSADLTKVPGIAETIGWGAALTALGAQRLEPEQIERNLGALLKYQEDLSALRGGGAAKLLDEVRAATR